MLMKCRHCNEDLGHIFLDLGFAPPSNAYVTSNNLNSEEKYYPLRVRVCEECWLVQTEDYANETELFDSNYAYFSSTSSGWLEHAKDYSDKVIKKFNLSEKSLVIEIASNDGYLLKNFFENKIPCFGIEPTQSTARACEKLGIPVIKDFFSENLAQKIISSEKKACLIIGNNVFAHVPDINDFTRGLKTLLNDKGVVTLEFPHLMELILNSQFDTIYHEHFSYFSLYTVNKIFADFGLRIFDIDILDTHGGSLRVYGCHQENELHQQTSRVSDLLEKEKALGLQDKKIYEGFQNKAVKIKNDLLAFLLEKKESGKMVVAYGAAAKGNTLLNFSGIKRDLIPYVFDAAIAKQGKFLPGSHIPILSPSMLPKINPDYVLILPWNISDEVKNQLSRVLNQKVKYMVAVPHLQQI
jgi:hypothetical protein